MMVNYPPAARSVWKWQVDSLISASFCSLSFSNIYSGWLIKFIYDYWFSATVAESFRENLTNILNRFCHTNMQIVSLLFCFLPTMVMCSLNEIKCLCLQHFIMNFSKCYIQVSQDIHCVYGWTTSWNWHHKPFKWSSVLHLCNLKLYILVSCQHAHLTWLHERPGFSRPWNVYSLRFKHFHLYLSVCANVQSCLLKKNDFRFNSIKPEAACKA